MSASDAIAVVAEAASALQQAAPTESIICSLCCEEDLSASPTAGVVLSTCLHRSCRACLVKWIEREEASGQTTPPTCPFCRSTIEDGDVMAIMGRSFRPKEATAGETNDFDEVDALTLDWINEHTVPCPGCANRIEKADGCDLIECLCGYRFCYKCGVADGNCSCNPGHHFLEEHIRVEEAPVRDSNGLVDLGSCIRRRQVRQEREERWYETEEEHWHQSYNPGVCTFNGRWLFSSKKGARCVDMLMQQLRQNDVWSQRSRSWWEPFEERSLDATWLFLEQGKDMRALQHAIERDNVRQKREENVRDGAHVPPTSIQLSWLFTRQGSELRVFEQLSRRDYIRQQRHWRNHWQHRETQPVASLDISWLFFPRAIAIQKMEHMITREEREMHSQALRHSRTAVRRRQKRLRNRREAEATQMANDLNMVWLFLPTNAGFRVLNQIDAALSKRSERAKVQDDACAWLDDAAAARSGAWLFQNETRAGSVVHLVHLMKKGSDELDEQCLESVLALFPHHDDVDCKE